MCIRHVGRSLLLVLHKGLLISPMSSIEGRLESRLQFHKQWISSALSHAGMKVAKRMKMRKTYIMWTDEAGDPFQGFRLVTSPSRNTSPLCLSSFYAVSSTSHIRARSRARRCGTWWFISSRRETLDHLTSVSCSLLTIYHFGATAVFPLWQPRAQRCRRPLR
jgi:hypothetical protein